MDKKGKKEDQADPRTKEKDYQVEKGEGKRGSKRGLDQKHPYTYWPQGTNRGSGSKGSAGEAAPPGGMDSLEEAQLQAALRASAIEAGTAPAPTNEAVRERGPRICPICGKEKRKVDHRGPYWGLYSSSSSQEWNGKPSRQAYWWPEAEAQEGQCNCPAER